MMMMRRGMSEPRNTKVGDLCDDLFDDIFRRLLHSPPTSSTISLVSKRWLSLRRSSTTALSLNLPADEQQTVSITLSSLLPRYPNLTSLTLTFSSFAENPNNFLSAVSLSCPKLRQFKYLVAPLRSTSLLILTPLSNSLKSLKFLAYRCGFHFRWLAGFSSLSDLSVTFINDFPPNPIRNSDRQMMEEEEPGEGSCSVDLQLDTVCFTGISTGDAGFDWLWKNSRRIRKLQLCSCEGVGVPVLSGGFAEMLKGIQEIELITCRSITGSLLFSVAENCRSLLSLVLHDGSYKDALIQVIRNCNSLQKLDLRLPLDLDDEILNEVALNCSELRRLCLRSCVLISGESLRLVAQQLGCCLEELVMDTCDVVEREPGLLTSLGQSMRRLQVLDLCYNELLLDKEVGAMLASCGKNLVELRLRGCGGLTHVTLSCIVKNCKKLEVVDVRECLKMTSGNAREHEGGLVRMMVSQMPKLREVMVEQNMSILIR